MDFSEWFDKHLQVSAEGFVWGVQQLPPDRYHRKPPVRLGDWSVARHIFHMVSYEQEIALPSMKLWLNARETEVEEVDEENDYDEEEDWQARCNEPVEALLSQFQAIRQEQIALLPRFAKDCWREHRNTGWGSVPLLWVVSKTYQHTAEHTNDVLRMALFWNYFEAKELAGDFSDD